MYRSQVRALNYIQMALGVILIAASSVLPAAIRDLSFGNNGIGRINNRPFAILHEIEVQNDGSILVLSGDFIARLLPNGQLDDSFGSNGVAPIPLRTLPTTR